MTSNTTTKTGASNLRNPRTLAFEFADAKEEYTDINIMLDAIFSSIDAIRKEAETNVGTDITEDTRRGVCSVLV